MNPFSKRPALRHVMVAMVVSMMTTGCGLFASRTLSFTPDQAPVTETVVADGHDTTYALRTPSYWLLSERRATLWNRTELDDAAWRYRSLFGTEPPMIAVRVDSVGERIEAGDSIATWHGIPVVAAPAERLVSVARGPIDPMRTPRADPSLALAAARGWLRATARAAVAVPNANTRVTRYPAWFEVATLVALSQSSRGGRISAFDAGRDDMALEAIFAVALPDGWSVHEVARSRPEPMGTPARATRPPERVSNDARARITPRFGAQALSVLSYLRERDPAVIPALAAGLARGQSVGEVLRTSTVLPHDLSALDADWRRWTRHRPKRSARNATRDR